MKRGSASQVKLRIWVKHDEVPRAAHAMASLKKAMKWDEDAFGETPLAPSCTTRIAMIQAVAAHTHAST